MAIQFSPETGSMLVPIQRPSHILTNLGERALADGFSEKPEFHVTVLSELSAEKVNGDLIRGCEQAMRAVDGLRFDVQVVPNAIWRVSKPKVVEGRNYERESVVAGVRSTYLDSLRTALISHTRLPMRQPFWHATLYTKGDEPYAPCGIGIETWDEFMRLKPERYDIPKPPTPIQ